MSVTFDGQNKIIQVDPGVTSVDVRTIYSRWKEWVMLSDNAKWAKAFRVTGGDPIGGGLFSPIFFFLVNGWTLRPDDTSGDHELTVSLNLYSDPDTAPRFTTVAGVTISNKTSDAAITNIDLLEFSSFQNAVTIDVIGGTAGTAFPKGTPQSPVNNLDDALTIAQARGIGTLSLIGDFDFNGTQNISGYSIIGESRERTEITIAPSVTISNVEFDNLTIVSGTLDGEAVAKNCTIVDLDYVNGIIESCILEGTITLGFGTIAHILDSWSGVVGNNTPTIDLGGSGQSLTLRNYNGGIKLINKTGPESVSIDMASGQVKIAASVTDGTIICRGVGEISENFSTGTAVVIDKMLNVNTIAGQVWDTDLSSHTDATTFGGYISKKLLSVAKFIGLK